MFSCCSSKKILTQIDTTCTKSTDESFVDVPITPKEIKTDPVSQETVIEVIDIVKQEQVIQEPAIDVDRKIQEAKDALIALELYETKNGLNMYVSSDSESD